MIIILPLAVYAQTISENQIKGAYLYKVTKFIRWKSEHVKICFLGEKEDERGQTLSKTVAFLANKENNPIEVLRNVGTSDIKYCSMVFIGTKSAADMDDIQVIVENKPIVTISDIDNITRHGIMFGFSKKDGNIVVDLNYQIAKKNGVDIRAALRELVNVVE